MKYYDVSTPLYLETDASGVSFGAQLLWVNDGMNCGHDESARQCNTAPNCFCQQKPVDH